MFNKGFRSTDSKLLVELITADIDLGKRLEAALASTGRFHVKHRTGRPAEFVLGGNRAPSSLLVLEVAADDPKDWAAVEQLLGNSATPTATIVLSDDVSDQALRRLLKLQVADLLSRSCAERDFVIACEQALAPVQSATSKPCHCTTFVSAVGGAGASTLSLAAAPILSRRRGGNVERSCVVDLNLQSGSIADYLDLPPNLQLSEIADAPERLDGHMLQVMLSRHASGIAVLAAPPAMDALRNIKADLIGRLLDLASAQFQDLVIDLPRTSLPLLQNIIHGADVFYIVTELSVTGLRHARRLADSVEDSCGVRTAGSVIVNKVPWLGHAGVGKQQASDVLGDKLAGFVGQCGKLPSEAQNRGLPLSQLKKRNRLETDLERILARARA